MKKDNLNMFIGVKQETEDSVKLTGFTVSPLKAKILFGVLGVGTAFIIDGIRRIILPSKTIEKYVDKHTEVYVSDKESE